MPVQSSARSHTKDMVRQHSRDAGRAGFARRGDPLIRAWNEVSAVDAVGSRAGSEQHVEGSLRRSASRSIAAVRRVLGLLLFSACATQPGTPAVNPESQAAPSPPPSKGWAERTEPKASPYPSTPPADPVEEVSPREATFDGAIKGILDKEHIRSVVRTNLGEVRRCYNAGLSRDPTLKGRVVVRFTISSEGRVQKAVVTETDIPDPTMLACLLSVAEEFVFPEPDGGGNVVVTYPFVFENAQPRTSDPAYAAAAALALGTLRPEVDACFRGADGKRPAITVEYTVDAAGKASNVTVLGLPPKSAPLDRCITEVFSKATMPKPGNPPVQVTGAP